MIKMPGKLIVEQTLMQNILLYLQEQPYRQVADLINSILVLNKQNELAEDKKVKEKSKGK